MPGGGRAWAPATEVSVRRHFELEGPVILSVFALHGIFLFSPLSNEAPVLQLDILKHFRSVVKFVLLSLKDCLVAIPAC